MIETLEFLGQKKGICRVNTINALHWFSFIPELTTTNFFYILDFFIFGAIPILVVIYAAKWVINFLKIFWPLMVNYYHVTLGYYVDFLFIFTTGNEDGLPDSAFFPSADVMPSIKIIKKDVTKVLQCIEITYYTQVDRQLLEAVETYYDKTVQYQFSVLNRMMRNKTILFPDILSMEHYRGPFESFYDRLVIEEDSYDSHAEVIKYVSLDRLMRIENGKLEWDKSAFSYYLDKLDRPTRFESEFYIEELIEYNPDVTIAVKRRYLDLIIIYWFIILFYTLPWLVKPKEKIKLNSRTKVFFLPYFHEFKLRLQDSRDKFLLSLLGDYLIFNNPDCQNFEDFVLDFQKTIFNHGWAGVRRKNTLLEFRRYESARMYERLVRSNAIIYFEEALRKAFYPTIYYTARKPCSDADFLRNKTNYFLEKKFYYEFRQPIFRSVFTAYSRRFLTAPREHQLSIKAKRLVGAMDVEESYFAQRYSDRLLAQQQILNSLAQRRAKERSYRLTKHKLKKKKLFFSKSKHIPFQGVRQLPIDFYRNTSLFTKLFDKAGARLQIIPAFDEIFNSFQARFGKGKRKRRVRRIEHILKLQKRYHSRDPEQIDFYYYPRRQMTLIQRKRVLSLSNFLDLNFDFVNPLNFQVLKNRNFYLPLDLFNYGLNNNRLSNSLAFSGLKYNFDARKRVKNNRDKLLFRFGYRFYLLLSRPKWWRSKARKLKFFRYLRKDLEDANLIFSFRKAPRKFPFSVRFSNFKATPTWSPAWSHIDMGYALKIFPDFLSFKTIWWDPKFFYELEDVTDYEIAIDVWSKQFRKKIELTRMPPSYCKKPKFWFYDFNLFKGEEYFPNKSVLFDSTAYYPNLDSSLIYFIGKRDFLNKKILFSKKAYTEYSRENAQNLTYDFLLRYYKAPKVMRRELLKFKLLQIFYRKKPISTFFIRRNLATIAVDGQSFPFLNFFNSDYHFFLNPSVPVILNNHFENSNFLAASDYHSFFSLPVTFSSRKPKFKRKFARMMKLVSYRIRRRRGHWDRRKRRNSILFGHAQNRLINRSWHNPKNILLSITRMYKNLAFRPIYRGLRWKRRYSLRQWRLLKLTKMHFMHPFLLRQLNSLYRQQADYILFQNTLQRWGHRYGYFHYDYTGTAYEPDTNLIFLSRHLAPFLLHYPRKSSIYYVAEPVLKKETFLQKFLSYFSLSRRRVYLGSNPNSLKTKYKVHKHYTKLTLSRQHQSLLALSDYIMAQNPMFINNFYFLKVLKELSLGKTIKSAEKLENLYFDALSYNARQLNRLLIPNYIMFAYWREFAYTKFKGMIDVRKFGAPIAPCRDDDFFRRPFDRKPDYKDSYIANDPTFFFSPNLQEEKYPAHRPRILLRLDTPRYRNLRKSYRFKANPKAKALWQKNMEFSKKEWDQNILPIEYSDTYWDAYTFYKFGYAYSLLGFRRILLSPSNLDLSKLPEAQQWRFSLATEYRRRPYEGINQLGQGPFANAFFKKPDAKIFKPIPNARDFNILFRFLRLKELKNLDKSHITHIVYNNFFKQAQAYYHLYLLQRLVDPRDELNFFKTNKPLLENSFLNSQLNNFSLSRPLFNQKILNLELKKSRDFKANTTYFFQLPLEQRRIYYRSLMLSPFEVVNDTFTPLLKYRNIENSLNFGETGGIAHFFYAWQKFSKLYERVGKIKNLDNSIPSRSSLTSYFFYHLYMQKYPIFLRSSYFDLLKIMNNYYAKALNELHSNFSHMLILPSKSFTNFTTTYDKLRPLMRYYDTFQPIFFSPKFPEFFFVNSHSEDVKVLPILSFLARHKQFDARVSFRKHFFYRSLFNERLQIFKKRRFFVNSYLKYLNDSSFYLDVHKNDFFSLKRKNRDLYHFRNDKNHLTKRSEAFHISSYLNFRYDQALVQKRDSFTKRRFMGVRLRKIDKNLFFYHLINKYPLLPAKALLYYRIQTFLTSNPSYVRHGFRKWNKKRLKPYFPLFFRLRLKTSFDQFVTKSRSYPHYTIIIPSPRFLPDKPLYAMENLEAFKNVFSRRRKYLTITPLLNNITFDDFTHYSEAPTYRPYRYSNSLVHNNMFLARFWNDERLIFNQQQLSYKYLHGLNNLRVKKKIALRLLNNEFILPYFDRNFFFKNKLNYKEHLKFILNNPETRYLKNIILSDIADPFFKKAKKIAQNKFDNLNVFEPFWRTNFYKLREFRPSDTRRFWPHDLSTTRRIFKRVANYVVFAPTDDHSYNDRLSLELRYAKNRKFFNQIKKIFKINDYDFFQSRFKELLLSNTRLSLALRNHLVILLKTLTPEKFYFNNYYFRAFTRVVLQILSRDLLGLPVTSFKKNYYNSVTSTLLLQYSDLAPTFNLKLSNNFLEHNKINFFQGQHSAEKTNINLARRLAYQQAVIYLTPILDFFIQKQRYSEKNISNIVAYIQIFANNISSDPVALDIPSSLSGPEGFLAKIFAIKFIQFYESSYKKLQMRSLKLNFLNQRLNFDNEDLPIFWAPNHYSNLGYSHLINRFQAHGIRNYLKKKTSTITNPYLLARPLGEIFYNSTPNKYFSLLNYLNFKKIFDKKLAEKRETSSIYSNDLQDLMLGHLGNGELEMAYPILNILNKEADLFSLDKNLFDNSEFKTSLVNLIMNNNYQNFVTFAPQGKGFYLPNLIPVNFIKTGLDNFDFLKLFNAELAHLILNQGNLDFLNDLEVQKFILRLHVLSSLFNSSFTNTFSNYTLFNRLGSRLITTKYRNRSVNDIFWQLRSFTRYPYEHRQVKDLFFFKFYNRHNLNPVYSRLPDFYNFHKKLDTFINNPNYLASYPFWFVDIIWNQLIRGITRYEIPSSKKPTRMIGRLPEQYLLVYPKKFFKRIQNQVSPFLFLHSDIFGLENFIILNRQYLKSSNTREIFDNNLVFKSKPIFQQFEDFFALLVEPTTRYCLIPVISKQRQFHSKVRLRTLSAIDYPLFSVYFKDLSPFNSTSFLPNDLFFKELKKSLKIGNYTPYTFDELQHQILLKRNPKAVANFFVKKLFLDKSEKNNSFLTYPFLMYTPVRDNSTYFMNNFKHMYQQMLLENIFFKNEYKINYKTHDKFAKQRFFKRPYRLPFKYADVTYRRTAFFKNHWRPSNHRLRKLLKMRTKLFYKPSYSFGPHPYHWPWFDELRAMVGLTAPRHLRKTDLRSIRHLTSHELEQIGLNYLIDYYPYLRLWYYSTEPAEYQSLIDTPLSGSGSQILHYYELPIQYSDPSELPFLACYAFYDRDPYTINPFWSTINTSYIPGLEYFYAYFYLVTIIFTLMHSHTYFYLFLGTTIDWAKKLFFNAGTTRYILITIFNSAAFFFKEEIPKYNFFVKLKYFWFTRTNRLRHNFKKIYFSVKSFFIR